MRFAVALALALATSTAFCDSWTGPAIKSAVSSDGNRIVRVEPGESIGDVFGFAGAAKGPYARATFYERDTGSDTYRPYPQVTLQNPVSPVDMLLNNAGNLVTLDNWHNVGYGPVIVIYEANGDIIVRYELEDLYSKERIADIDHTVSSRWWRCATVEPRLSNELLWVADAIGGQFEFDLADGSFEYSQENVSCPGN